MRANGYHNSWIIFRAVEVSLDIIQTYQTLLPDIEIEHCVWCHGSGQVMIIQLDSEKVCTMLARVIKEHPISAPFGIWVSLVTEYDNDGLTVPSYVCSFFREVGGSIDFSFTNVGGDTENQSQEETQGLGYLGDTKRHEDSP